MPPPALPEADWKVLRRVHPLAVGRFCERVLGEVERVLRDSAQSRHERYPGRDPKDNPRFVGSCRSAMAWATNASSVGP